MIRTGILSDNCAGSEPARLVSFFKELRITSASVNTKESGGKYSSAEEELVHSSDIIYVDLPVFSAEQVKFAFRSGTHIFFRRVPALTIDEASELINLESEAGCFTQICHPHLFFPENLPLFRDLQKPLLVNVRLKANPAERLEDQLRSVFLILAFLDQSTLKKLDVTTLEGDHLSYVMDIRLAYSSGSISRVIISTHFQKEQSVLELFQMSRPIISLPLDIPDHSRRESSELQALKEFLKIYKNQQAVMLSLNEYLQAQMIMEKVSEKLKMRGSLLLE